MDSKHTKHQDSETIPAAKRLWSPVISFLSLGISMVALWYSLLAPADIKSSISSPMFLWQPGIETPIGAQQAKPVLMMEATCSFSNNGAHIGEISYVVLSLESDDGTRWLFSPYWIVDETKFLTDGFSKRTWMSGQFHSVLVPGKQTVAYSYMFVAESGLSRFQEPSLTPHKFKARLLTWFPANSRPREQQSSQLDFDENLIANLSRGVAFGMPFREQQERVQSIR